MIHFLVSFIRMNLYVNQIRSFCPIEDTYWKPDVVDQQDVLVKVMDTYGKVPERDFPFLDQKIPSRMINVYLII